MSTIYFNVMVGNERKFTVEIRKIAENMTPPVWAYEITGNHRTPAFRSTLATPSTDELELVRQVLMDYHSQPAEKV